MQERVFSGHLILRVIGFSASYRNQSDAVMVSDCVPSRCQFAVKVCPIFTKEWNKLEARSRRSTYVTFSRNRWKLFRTSQQTRVHLNSRKRGLVSQGVFTDAILRSRANLKPRFSRNDGTKRQECDSGTSSQSGVAPTFWLATTSKNTPPPLKSIAPK